MKRDDEIAAQAIARAFRRLRRRAGVTRAELARLAGVPLAAVAEIEAGRISPAAIKAIAALAQKSRKK